MGSFVWGPQPMAIRLIAAQARASFTWRNRGNTAVDRKSNSGNENRSDGDTVRSNFISGEHVAKALSDTECYLRATGSSSFSWEQHVMPRHKQRNLLLSKRLFIKTNHTPAVSIPESSGQIECTLSYPFLRIKSPRRGYRAF